jgi:hypothetical protein
MEHVLAKYEKKKAENRVPKFDTFSLNSGQQSCVSY